MTRSLPERDIAYDPVAEWEINSVQLLKLRRKAVAKTAARRVRQTLVVLALVGPFPACFFKSPLDAVARLPVDAAILGTWRCLVFDERSNAKPFNLTVTRASDTRYAIVLQQDGEEPAPLEGYASVVKGQTLVNVRVPDEDAEPWLVARYSLIRPYALHVQLIAEDKLKEADASPESLRRALEKAHKQKDLFVDYCLCVGAKD